MKLKFTLFTIPIEVHLSALANIFFIGIYVKGGLSVPFLILGMIGLILIHEFGHAYFVIRQKGFVHSVHIRFMSGICFYDLPLHDTDNDKKEIMIAWGGVIFQFLLMSISILLLFII